MLFFGEQKKKKKKERRNENGVNKWIQLTKVLENFLKIHNRGVAMSRIRDILLEISKMELFV